MHDNEFLELYNEIKVLKENEIILKESLHSYKILHAIISITSKAQSQEQLFADVLSETIKLLDFDGGGIYLADEVTKTAQLVFYINVDEKLIKEKSIVSTNIPPYDILFEKGMPIFTDQYEKVVREGTETFGYASLASVPIISGEKILGAINVAVHSHQKISENNQRILCTIGNEIGNALFRINQQNRVHEERRNLLNFMDTVDDMLFVLDEKGTILLTNQSVRNKLGYSAEELINKPVIELHVPDRRDEAARIVVEMIQGLREYCPVPLITKNHSVIDVETKISIGTWDGKPVIFGVTRDITDRLLTQKKLEKSEKKLRDVTENIGEGVILLDKQFSASFCNREAEQILGYTLGELNSIGVDKLMQLSPPSMITAGYENVGTFLEIFASGTRFYSTDVLMQNKSGKQFPISFICSPILEDNQVAGIVVTFKDITERKEALNALIESENRFKLLAETAPVMIWLSDINLDFTYVNTVWCDFTGKSFADELGSGWMGSVHIEDLQIWKSMAKTAKKTPQTIHQQIRMRNVTGEFRWITMRGAPRYTANKEFAGYIGTGFDTTERKQFEEQLSREAKKWNTILQESLDAIFVVGINGEFIEYNQAFVQMTGYAGKESNLLHISSIEPDKDSKQFFASIVSLNDSLFETHILKKDGSLLACEVDSSKTDWNGEIAFICILRDITERKLAAQKLNEYANNLKELNASKDKFFSIIAHDLRSPFQNFLIISDMLSKQINSMDQSEISMYAEILHNSLTNQFELLEQLLQWARIQTGRFKLHKTEFEIKGLVNKIQKQFEIAIAKKGLSLVVEDVPDVKIRADKDVVELLLRNVIGNSIKFTDKGGTIAVHVFEKGTQCTISIKDTGVGMTEDVLESLFKIDKAKSTSGTNNEKGTGLGLILCKELLDKHGSDFSVTSEAAIGTVFEFSLELVK